MGRPNGDSSFLAWFLTSAEARWQILGRRKRGGKRGRGRGGNSWRRREGREERQPGAWRPSTDVTPAGRPTGKGGCTSLAQYHCRLLSHPLHRYFLRGRSQMRGERPLFHRVGSRRLVTHWRSYKSQVTFHTAGIRDCTRGERAKRSRRRGNTTNGSIPTARDQHNQPIATRRWAPQRR